MCIRDSPYLVPNLGGGVGQIIRVHHVGLNTHPLLLHDPHRAGVAPHAAGYRHVIVEALLRLHHDRLALHRGSVERIAGVRLDLGPFDDLDLDPERLRILRVVLVHARQDRVHRVDRLGDLPLDADDADRRPLLGIAGRGLRRILHVVGRPREPFLDAQLLDLVVGRQAVGADGAEILFLVVAAVEDLVRKADGVRHHPAVPVLKPHDATHHEREHERGHHGEHGYQRALALPLWGCGDRWTAPAVGPARSAARRWWRRSAPPGLLRAAGCWRAGDGETGRWRRLVVAHSRISSRRIKGLILPCQPTRETTSRPG